MDTGVIIFFSLFAIIILSFILYAILKKLKGSLKISLLENSKSSGEILSGTIELRAKRQIESERFYIALVGKEKHTRYQDGSEKTSYLEIYRSEKTIEGEKVYYAGFQDTFRFEIEIPFSELIGENNTNQFHYNMEDFIEKNQLNNGILGTAVKLLASNNGFLNNKNKKIIVWQIEASVEAKGIDLDTKKRVYVNLSSKSSQNGT